MIPVAAEGSVPDTTPGTGKTAKAQKKIAATVSMLRKHMPFFSSTRYPRVLPAEMPPGGAGDHLRHDCRCPVADDTTPGEENTESASIFSIRSSRNHRNTCSQRLTYAASKPGLPLPLR
jgi:hypothetical protein